MIIALSATKPRKKCAICKYWDGERPKIHACGYILVEEEAEGVCQQSESCNCNKMCTAIDTCESFERFEKYSPDVFEKERATIKTLHIPKPIDSLNDKIIKEFVSLEEITVDEENMQFCAVDGVLFSKDKKTLILYPAKRKSRIFRIPEEMKSAKRKSIEFGTYIEVLDIGKKDSIDIWDFPYRTMLIEAFSADEDNPSYCTEDGVLYSADKTCLLSYPNAKEDYFFEVPEEVDSISCQALFCNNGYLHEISIRENCDDFDIGDIFSSAITTINIIREDEEDEYEFEDEEGF